MSMQLWNDQVRGCQVLLRLPAVLLTACRHCGMLAACGLVSGFAVVLQAVQVRLCRSLPCSTGTSQQYRDGSAVQLVVNPMVATLAATNPEIVGHGLQ